MQPAHAIAPPAAYRPRAARAAFTLTELLVVITIIAILASLGTYGVTRAFVAAKQTKIKVEVDQLDMALKAYREKYGSYPPCNLAINSSATALASVRATCRPGVPAVQPDELAERSVMRPELTITSNFRPDQALVFWLQGFSSDPQNPFITPAGVTNHRRHRSKSSGQADRHAAVQFRQDAALPGPVCKRCDAIHQPDIDSVLAPGWF